MIGKKSKKDVEGRDGKNERGRERIRQEGNLHELKSGQDKRMV